MSDRKIEKIYINRVAYGILCLIVGFLFVFYLDALTFTLLFAFGLLPLVSYGLCRYSFPKLEGRIAFSDKQITQGEEVELKVVVENTGFAPVANVRGKIVIFNSFEDKKQEYEMNFNVKGFGENEVVLKISSESCALIKAEWVSIYMYDYLGMFKTKMKNVGTEALVYVFPAKRDYDFSSVSGKEDEEEEKNIIGEDTSEIVDIRTFRRGDKLNRIHWKLTLKCDETMVKEFGDVYGNKFTIGFELCKNISYDVMDDILVVLYEVGRGLARDNKEFVVKWYDGYRNIYMEETINNIVDFDKAYRKVLESGPVATDKMLYTHEKEENKGHFVYITAEENISSCEGEVMGSPCGKAVLLWI